MKQRIDDLIKRTAEKIIVSGSVVGGKTNDDHEEVLFAPITIGRVLELDSKNTCDLNGCYVELCRLWQPCGFAKSLQELIEESGYIDCGCEGEKHDYLKNPNTRALFEYLIDIL